MTDPCAPLEKALRDLMAVNHGPEPFSDRQGNLHPCLCAAHEAARLLLLSAPSPVREPEGLTVDRLAAAINDAQIQPDELRLGRDLRIPAARLLARLTPERPADEVDG